MLEFKNVRKQYGDKKVLTDLSLRLDAGEVVGLLASNGGGKTTAMRIAMGLLSHNDGAVTVFDKPVERGLVRGVGYMPEERGLYPEEAVKDQLRYLAILSKLPKSDIDGRVDELLDQLQIAKYKDYKLKELSLGNKQRVQIAAALVGNPRLLILDEPFSGLDPLAVQFFSKLIRDYAAEGAGVLFSSHQLDVVEQVAERVAIMKDGRLIFDGGLEELKRTNQQTIAIVRFTRDALTDPGALSFDKCPNVVRSTVNDGVAELELKGDGISIEEIALSGLKTSEIVEVAYKPNTFGAALAGLYEEDDQHGAVEK